MRPRHFLLFTVILFSGFQAASAQDFLDNLGDHLKFNAANGAIAGKLSGLVDFDQYYVQQPAPGLIYSSNSFLTNPHITLNLDVQMGKQFYLFVQGSGGRGFDPGSYKGGQVRLDQYALRYTPRTDDSFNVQVGQFSTIVGNWTSRHDSWSNPFINAPVPYENLGGIYDSQAGTNGLQLNSWINSDKRQQIPIVWGPSYATGLSLFGSLGTFDYAFEVKNAALSSRPESWSGVSTGFDNPTYSARLGYRPSEEWNLGVSSSYGTYLESEAESTFVPGHDFSDYGQITIAQDASYAWHHIQLWAECYESRYQVPTVGNLDTVAYYIEAKYKFTPQFFAAVRWNQQYYNSIPDGFGGTTKWGGDLSRIDIAGTYRFSPHIQAKLQYSFTDEDASTRRHNNLVAGQLTVRF